MELWINILLIVVFQLISGAFSCTEMALVSLRDSQVERMKEEGPRGKKIAAIVGNPNRFLSAVQIGTTFTGFLSASFGASTVVPFFVPMVRHMGINAGVAEGLTTVVVTFIISYFSIVISEMVPKRIAMQKNEQIARAIVPFVTFFVYLCLPLIWLISGLTNLLVRLLGFDPHRTSNQVTDDELRTLVTRNTAISKEERTILDEVFDAAETALTEVMRPRADVTFLEGKDTIQKAAAEVHSLPYSRYPVIGEDFDNVLGFVHVRDLLDVPSANAVTVKDVTRPILSIPGTARLLPTLNLLRRENMHIAIVIDEYGGTDGIITLEDLIEELIGDIRDEYDIPSMDRNGGLHAFVNGVAAVEGGMIIEDFADFTGIKLEDGPYETVAGYFLAHTGKMAKKGDVYHSDEGYDMVITEVDGRRIQTIEIRKTDTPSNTTSDNGPDTMSTSFKISNPHSLHHTAPHHNTSHDNTTHDNTTHSNETSSNKPHNDKNAQQ